MVLKFPAFSCLVVLVNLVGMIEMLEEYDDPASDAYEELRVDFTKFEKAIMWANFKRPKGSQKFFLKAKEKSCANRCDETRKHDDIYNNYYCHCDKLCPLYKDCCVDYWPKCNVTTKPFNQSQQEFWDCVDAKFRQSKNNRSLAPLAYMMINRCPVNKTNSQSSHNCSRPGTSLTDISERIPVTGDDHKTYRNSFCAECHGIKNFTHWGLAVACLDPAVKNKTDLPYNSTYLKENCDWYFSPGHQITKSPCTRSTMCESVITTDESSKYDDLVNKCKAYSQLVEADHVLYKNFHCASCNGKDVIKFQKPPIQFNLPSLSLFFDYKSLSRGSGSNNAGGLTTEKSANGSKTHESANGSKTQENANGSKSDENTNGSKNHQNIQGYLTVIGLSLSIMCLLAVVITYIRFKTLRTVPGLVLLSLSISLLAYQSTLLVSPFVTLRTAGCKTVAILLHFMILNSFAWMTVMSYDVSKTFSQNGKSSSRNSSRSGFRRYVIFTSSTSGVIVALTYTLGATRAMDVGYGEYTSCWIGTQLALILFFYIPVGIMLLFNTVSLIWTILSIRNVTKLTKGVQKSVKSDTRGQNAKIYGKLSTVMGVTWFLGFGAAHSTIVAYLYIIINSLQGVFIFVTFVLNKRTMKMWRNTASTRNARSSTHTRQTRVSKFTKGAEPYSSTNKIYKDKEEQQETGFTNPQLSFT